MMEKEQREFIAYDYKQVQTHPNKSSFMIDSYQNFGWTLDENAKPSYPSSGPSFKTVLRFKRDRKIMNKMKLTRLQRNFEFCLNVISSYSIHYTKLYDVQPV